MSVLLCELILLNDRLLVYLPNRDDIVAGGSTVQHDLNAPPGHITVNRRILQSETEGTSAGECHPELPHAALQQYSFKNV